MAVKLSNRCLEVTRVVVVVVVMTRTHNLLVVNICQYSKNKNEKRKKNTGLEPLLLSMGAMGAVVAVVANSLVQRSLFKCI